MEELNPPKFLDLLEEFEADDIVTKISEVKTLMQDIESKTNKRRPVQKEKKALQTKIQELSEQFFDVGVRPTIANSKSSNDRTLNVSAESETLLRKILILVTSEMNTTAMKDKLLDYTTEFANLAWKGITAGNNSVDCDEVMWQPDPSKVHYQDDPMELKTFNASFDVPELGSLAKHPQNRPNEGDDPCGSTVEYEWPGQVSFQNEKDIKKQYGFEGIENDVNMRDEEEEAPPAMLSPWYNPSVSSSKSGQSPPSSDGEDGEDTESRVEPGVGRSEEDSSEDGERSTDEGEVLGGELGFGPADELEAKERSGGEEDDNDDDNDQWYEAKEKFEKEEGMDNDVVDGRDGSGFVGDDSDEGLMREIEEHREYTRALLASRASRDGGNSALMSDGESLHGDGDGYPRGMEMDDGWDPEPLRSARREA
ncbi:uncharacterized protein Bfra_006049 [Botrytis fragariae]|uniref:Uncharacterized protein n=1 Tax=Botrytis fragariae TaxID=1964551 RepID=A0A8H6EHS5_9HELO|nr:uncharacterized protein Bfra_006049 [Botrytis fragariae]KAF5872686.1 hypothetical protein Bfra_006049 [Botrytis fragariae]